MSELLDRLKYKIQPYCGEGIVLGFSGGVDSSLLLAVLSQIKEKKAFSVMAVMMRSAFQPEEECREAECLARQFAIPFFLIEYDPLSIPEIQNNCRERCYFCKKYFFTKIFEFASAKKMKYVFDGTNADDLTKYRPGLKAIRELGVCSPLAEIGFSKENIRTVSREIGLITADKPAAPCLATRFDYGMTLTHEKLQRIANGENVIRRMIPEASEIRLRVEHEHARIEISAEQIPKLLELKDTLFRELNLLGFEKIIIDPEGYRSGSFDKFFVS